MLEHARHLSGANYQVSDVQRSMKAYSMLLPARSSAGRTTVGLAQVGLFPSPVN
jgi:hypothetical protein